MVAAVGVGIMLQLVVSVVREVPLVEEVEEAVVGLLLVEQEEPAVEVK